MHLGGLTRLEQCDQIGRLFKALGDNFVSKVALTLYYFLGYFGKHHFLSKNLLWLNFGKYVRTFFSITFGHAGLEMSLYHYY